MKLNLEIKNEQITTKPYTVTWETAVRYALGIGASTNDLDLLWESHPKFTVFPTFAVVPTFPLVVKSMSKMNVDLARVVHGGQTISINAAIPLNEPLVSTGRVTEILDKGKGAVATIDTETKASDDKLIFTTSWSIFCRGQGGFGGERGEAPVLPDPLDGEGTLWTGTTETRPEQALLYRLSGDLNPLHVDPELAQKVGFKAPILHGLCTYGQAARSIMSGLYNSEWNRLKSFSARFSKEVYPGDHINVDVRPTAHSQCHRLEASVGERTVLSHGVIEVS